MTSEQITPVQIKAARALLAWSQKDLAREANVGQSTVADFERGQRTPIPNSTEAMREALVKAGISFLPGGVVVGPMSSDALKTKYATGGAPFRWINSTDLDQWADRRDAQSSMPELICRLIRAETGHEANLRFPSDESVQQEGWDGLCHIENSNDYIPSGYSGWEIGTQRNRITKKADEDYEKRTSDSREIGDIAKSTFVFVTPRHWPGKSKWIKKRKAEGKWADVRVYDGDDLVHWIERNAAVADWLAKKIGKYPNQSILQLSEAWEEWSLSTRYPLSTDLILAGRDDEATAILRWLRGQPSIFCIQAESIQEGIAFLHASIQQLPETFREPYHSRCLVATSNDAGRVLANSLSPLIVVLVEPESGLAQRLAKKGHHVYVVCGPEANVSKDVTRLPIAAINEVERALIDMGIDEKEARRFARDSGRSLAVLRRLIPASPIRGTPEWADSKFCRTLLYALFAGAWDESKNGDREILEQLVEKTYDKITEDLSPFLGSIDSPLRKIGNIWKVSSPRDAWILLAHYIAQADFDRFKESVIKVLSTSDPRYEMKSDERWLANTKGIVPTYSKELRQGLTETMILLSVFPNETTSLENTSLLIDNIIRTLFKDADRKRWWSLSRNFQLLAEASPEAFLSAVEDSLAETDPPILSLFGEEKSFFGEEHLSGLLWALECLAWHQQYLGRVTEILVVLASHDPGGTYTNRPKNSLRQIFLVWLPQTHATLSMRLAVLDSVRKKHAKDIVSNVVWKLMLDIMPGGYDTSQYSPTFKWRQHSVETPETITYGLMAKAANELARRLFDDVGLNPERWTELIENFNDLPPEWRNKMLQLLSDSVPSISDDAARLVIWKSLRSCLHHHRSFPDAEWSLPAEDLNEIERIYNELEPGELEVRSAWMFSRQRTELPRPNGSDWDANEKQLATFRKEAIRDIVNQRGLDAVFTFANSVDSPGLVGDALVELFQESDDMEIILKKALTGPNNADKYIGYRIVVLMFDRKGEAWASSLLQRAALENWGFEAISRIFVALPPFKWTWERVAEAGHEIEDYYWKNMEILWIKGTVTDIEFAVQKLLKADRPLPALHVAGHHLRDRLISNGLLCRVLEEAKKVPLADLKGNDTVMFEHYVEEIFKRLYEATDLSQTELAKLEWAYLRILSHHRKHPLILHKVLSMEPSFFVEVLSAMFRPAEDSGIQEPSHLDQEQTEAIASHAFELFHTWHRLPGTQDDGSVNPDALNKWIEESRNLCAKVGRAVIGDLKIGDILAASPVDSDGNWPICAVRDVIENLRSRDIERGLLTGLFNRRGVTSRGVLDGGDQERELAQRYRKSAEAMQFRWPRMAALLEKIAQGYERDGKWWDEDAEKIQW